MQHSLGLNARFFNSSTVDYTVNPQFKAILQASHYRNYRNLKYYTRIFLTIHIKSNTGQLCMQFI
jgi:hypothetical protein